MYYSKELGGLVMYLELGTGHGGGHDRQLTKSQAEAPKAPKSSMTRLYR